MPGGRKNGGVVLNAKSDENIDWMRLFWRSLFKRLFLEQNRKTDHPQNDDIVEGIGMGGASTAKEEYGNMAAEKLRKSGIKNRKEHFNIESCAPVDGVEVPKQIKEPAYYNQVELSSRASGKREYNNIDESLR